MPNWIDPFIGLRIRHQLAPYSFQISVHYGVTYSGLLGYRALSVDYEKDSGASKYAYDVIQHGPLLGLTVSF